jgi:hypothetical protein
MKSQQSKDDNNLNNWKKQGSPTKSDYPKLLNDSGYVAWKPRIIRRSKKRRHAHSAFLEQEEASIYYDTSSEIMDVLANKSVSSDVFDNIRHVFASQQEFKPRNPDADLPKDFFISLNPEFRKSWSRLDKKSQLFILHCKAGTGKKNHELQVQNHDLQVHHKKLHDASDTSDVTLHLGTSAIETSLTEPSTCTTLSASAASTSNKPGKQIPCSGRPNLPPKSSLHPGHPARMLSNKSKISIQDCSGNTLHFTANMAVQHTLQGTSCYHGLHDLLPSSLPSTTPCPMATYSISKRRVVHHTHHGLVDGGAKSGIGSDRDMRILAYDADDRRVNISGVGNHLVNDMRIALFCAVTKSQLGLVLLVYNQYAYVPQQTQSIHSKIQMQDFGNLVCDSAIKVGGNPVLSPRMVSSFLFISQVASLTSNTGDGLMNK